MTKGCSKDQVMFTRLYYRVLKLFVIHSFLFLFLLGRPFTLTSHELFFHTITLAY